MNILSTPPNRTIATAGTAEIARRLGQILAGLAALVARRFLKMPHLVGFTVLLWGRLGRMARRFERMVTRPPRARTARVRDRDRTRAQSPALPRGRGWLVRELGYEAAGYGCQLEALLAEPATRAVLAELPALGRIMRPLCRMLGVTIAAAEAEPVAPAPAPAPAPCYWRSAGHPDAPADPDYGVSFAKSG